MDAEEGGADVAGRERAKVEISVPEDLMDFLVEADGHVEPAELVEQLRGMGPMTLVAVATDKESVRVWLE